MVAATFPNLSFENPPGTGPTLISASVEPFAFVEGNTLEVRFAGDTVLIVLTASDFADIANATAVEVATLIAARVDDLAAEDDGGAVRLTSLLTGEDVSLEVLGGSANAVLGFPLGAVNGITYAGGPPNGWSVSGEVDTVREWAEFADENGRPEEIFGEAGWAILPIIVTFSDALFDFVLIPTLIETFTGWSPSGFATSATMEGAVFNTVLTDEAFEDGWGLPIYFNFTPANLITGIDPETFETAWGQGGAPTFSALAPFANTTKTEEDFEDVLATTHTVQPISAAAGLWTVTIDGDVHTYTASGGDTVIDIATGLASAITSQSVVASATNFLSLVAITPLDPDATLSVTATPPIGGLLEIFLAPDQPAYAEEWVGQDTTPDFD